MLKEFREFVLRGNVIDLAVAVVMGAAFGAVVTALVSDLITPLIGAVGGQAKFVDLKFTINGSQFAYGHFLNQVVSLLLIGAVVFFGIVKPLNLFHARRKEEEAPAPEAPAEDVRLLTEIRDLLAAESRR